mgnify:CR=1 FL=1
MSRRRKDRALALDLQERQAPTVAETLVLERRVEGEGSVMRVRETRVQVRRRVLDQRLWNTLDPEQQAAAERLFAGWSLHTRGLGCATSAFTRLRVDGNPVDAGGSEVLLSLYARWRAACGAEGVDDAALVAVLCEGHSCQRLDSLRRRRKGTTAQELRVALDLYRRLWRGQGRTAQRGQ